LALQSFAQAAKKEKSHSGSYYTSGYYAYSTTEEPDYTTRSTTSFSPTTQPPPYNGDLFLSTIADCPTYASYDQVLAELDYVKEIMNEKWGKWPIVGLADNASLSGQGYQWAHMGADSRWATFGGYLCTKRGYAVSRDNQVDTIPTLYKQWALSVDIMPTGTVYGWSNVLHVGIGGDVATYGDRTPAIYLGSGSTSMHISSAIDSNSNNFINLDSTILPMDVWTQVAISQFQLSDETYQYTVTVGNNIVHQVQNSDAQEFNDVKVSTSDDFFPESKARVDNLRVSTFPDGVTQSFNTVLHYNYMEMGPIIKQGARLKRGVKFSVQAQNDIHISLSKSNPITTDSWEIVLGAMRGTQTLLRKSHQGTNLATIHHTKEQFMEWQQNFELKMTNTKLGLYHANGDAIIEYKDFDATDIQYMYAATGFGSTGQWIVNIQEDGFDSTRDPEIGLSKVVARFGSFMDENLSKHTNFVTNVKAKINKIADRMSAKYQKLNAQCDLWTEPEDEEGDGLRYSSDPCKAAVQIPKSMMKWSNVYNVHCKTGSTAFPERIQNDMDKMVEKLQNKLKIC